MEYQCEHCEYKTTYPNGFTRHIKQYHKGNPQEYYNNFILTNSEEKICVYCGEESLFERITTGYKPYCLKCKKFHRRTKKEYWIKYHNKTETEAIQIIKEQNTHTEKTFIKRFGVDEGKAKWDDYRARCVKGAKKTFATKDKQFFLEKTLGSVEYWLKRGHTPEEAKINSDLHLEKLRDNHWEKRKKNPKWRETLNSQFEYWLKKTNGDVKEAKKLYKNRQNTFSKIKCIERHGEIEGKRVFLARQAKWLASLPKANHSKIADKFFGMLVELTKSGTYAKHGGELFLSDYDNNIRCFYDFTFENIVVEFQGDIWHANPEMFDKNDKPNPFNDLTSEEIWNKDLKKKELAEKNGYKVLYVWEKSVYNNINQEVNNLYERIMNEVEYNTTKICRKI